MEFIRLMCMGVIGFALFAFGLLLFVLAMMEVNDNKYRAFGFALIGIIPTFIGTALIVNLL